MNNKHQIMPKRSKTKLSHSKRFRTLQENDPKKVARGEDMYGYGEQKQPCNLSLTSTAKKILLEAAQKNKLSQSEFIEQWLRKEVAQTLDTSDKD